MTPGSDRWLVLAALLLLAPSIYWANEPSGIQKPVSPLDRTNFGEATHWIVVAAARPHIPPGTSVMPVASERSSEMSMFMFAVGLFPENDVLPRSYWSDPVDAGTPEYVISFGCAPIIAGGALIAEVPYGCVFRMQR